MSRSSASACSTPAWSAPALSIPPTPLRLWSRNCLIYAVVLAVVAGLAGCSSSNPASSPSPTPTPAPSFRTLYTLVPNLAVPGSSAMEVVGFASNGTGASSPISTLTLPVDLTTLAMTTDSAGEIYVAGTRGGNPGIAEILVYASGSTGNAQPARTILTGQPPTYLVGSIAVDSAGQIYVANGLLGTVEVFAADANGASTPVRTLGWDPAVFNGGMDLAVDGSGALYVLGYHHGTAAGLQNPTEVVVYAPGASGAATPVRTLVGANAGFVSNSASIAVDAAGNLFAIVSNPANPWMNATEVAEYAPGADGNAVPVKTIVGNFGAFGVGPTHLQIDAADNVYVVSQFENYDLPQTPIPVPPLIATFPASATGAAVPANQFTSAAINDGAFGFAAH